MRKYIHISNNTQSVSDVTVEQRQLAFQLWVAYDLYGRCEEDLAGQVRCPLIGCSISFESLGLCLQHLITCAWLPNSWYWCPQCQRPERFTEPEPTLTHRSKLEPDPGPSNGATPPGKRSTVAQTTTARLWKHIRNKSIHLVPHSILQMSRSRRGVNFIASDRQSPPDYGFPYDPSAFYHVRSAAAGTHEKTVVSQPTGLSYPPNCLDKHYLSTQYPELEAAPSNLELDACLNQRHELESQSSSPNFWTASMQRQELDSRLYGPKNPTSSERWPELEGDPWNPSGNIWWNQHHELESLSECPNTLTPSTQRPELDSHMYALNNVTTSERRPELGPSPVNDSLELPGDQPWTERWTKNPTLIEAYVNKPDCRQLFELMGSSPSSTDTQCACPPYEDSSIANDSQSGSSWNPTVPPAFIAGYSIPDSPLHYDSATQHHGPSFQPLGSVPTGFNLAGHNGSHIISAMNTAFTQHLTPSNQSTYQGSPVFPKSLPVDHGQERVMTSADLIEGQSNGKTHRFRTCPETDPSADHTDIVTRNNPCCKTEALLRTVSMHEPVMSVPRASKETQSLWTA